MAYEIFTRKVLRRGSPGITITKIGRIAINKSATEALEKNAVEFVLVMWDAESLKIGIRPITKKDSRAYPLKYGDKGNGAGFSAKTFLDYIGFDYTNSNPIPASWNEDYSLLEAVIPPELIRGAKQQRLLAVEHPKKSVSG